MSHSLVRSLLTLTLVLSPVVVTSWVQPAQAADIPTYEAPRKSRARGQVKMFLRHLKNAERARQKGHIALMGSNIDSARQDLVKIRQRDSALDVTVLQNALNAFEQEHKALTGQASAAKDTAQAYMRQLNYLMTHTINTTWMPAQARAHSQRIDKDIAAYRRTVDQLAALPVPARATANLKMYHQMMQQRARQMPQQLQQLKAVIKNDPLQGQVGYNEVATQSVYWYAAAKLFPQDPQLQQAYQQIKALKDSVGSRAQASQAKAARVAQAAKNSQLPAAHSRDAALEQKFKQVFEAQGWKEPVLALRLTSDWWPERNKATGVLLGRKRDAAIAVKLKSGSCRLYNFTFFQSFDGAKYTGIRRSSHSSKPIDCGNI